MAQNLLKIDSPNFITLEELQNNKNWSLIFGNDNKLVLEIGCGVGDFLVAVAKENQDLNFVAIDFYNKGCLKTSKRVDKEGLKNVRIIRAEAVQFIQEFIDEKSLQKVFINCPDPWPKLKHRKRRLVNEAFVQFLSTYMISGGDFHFATDFVDYGEDVANFMTNLNQYKNVLTPDLFRHERPEYPLSKYMKKFMAEGKKIYFVHYRAI